MDESQIQVTDSGGARPVWNRDGSEILYLAEEGIMSVSVGDAGPSGFPTLGRPELALEMPGIESFDISPDGETFVISRQPLDSAATRINIVLNWFEELKAKVPVE